MKMKPSRISLVALVTFAVSVGAMFTGSLEHPRTVGAAGDPNAAKALYYEKCSACHNAYDPTEKAYTHDQWSSTIDRMLNKHGASGSISPDQASQILAYLSLFAPKPGQNSNLDPTRTVKEDVWPHEPDESKVYLFPFSSTISELSAVNGKWRIVPGATPADGAVVQTVSLGDSGRFAYLLTREAPGQGDLDISTDFHIVSGKLSPAVGIVIGYQNTNNFDVVRYNALTSDVALIKVSGGQHTTIQKVPLTSPLLTAQKGWHTMRVVCQANGNRIAVWLDYNKQMTTADPAYALGKVGLWTQGDSIAEFHKLIVDQYRWLSPKG